MKKFYLNDLLQLSREEIAKTKIKLNVSTKDKNPLDIYKRNPKDILEWNYWNNQKYLIGQISICLVRLGQDRWLFCHLGRIKGVINIPKDTGVGYIYDEDDRYECFYGRVIVKYHNSSKKVFRRASSLIQELEVVEILPSIYTGFDFPGYENVHLTWKELHTIVKGNYPSYQNALRQQKAVYLITDTQTGKLYVGSATSKRGMLLDRWSNYAHSGHGGNKELRQLIKNKGFDCIKKYFTYTIIENYNKNVSDDYIWSRESYWKNVLKTRTFGYNDN